MPLTQAVRKQRSRSKSQSSVKTVQHTVLTRQNSKNILNGATRIPVSLPSIPTPVLSQELSLEFQSDWSGDISNSPSPVRSLSPSPSPSKVSDSISQLKSKTIKALEHEDKRVKNFNNVPTSQQVRFAIDNPITTLEGLQKLRLKRALNKPPNPLKTPSSTFFQTSPQTLEPEKSKNVEPKTPLPKTRNIPKRKINKPKLIFKEK